VAVLNLEMSSFEVPPDYRGFVSSAKELFEQFKIIGESDRLVFRIFALDVSGVNLRESVHRYADIFLQIEKFLQTEIASYLWFREIPQLYLSINTVAGASGTASAGSVFLQGSLRVGDCVDDEWYMVKVLLALSERFPSFVISVVDSDGQFLLIEAAAHIGDWIDPVNADNRVWIREGLVHIIPLEAPGRNSSDSIDLQSAFEYFQLRNDNSRSYSKLVQSCISARIQSMTTGYIAACKHTCVCYLPKVVAVLISDTPGLLSNIINELGKQSMARDGTGDAPKRKFSDKDIWESILSTDDDSSYCRVKIEFTRALFAKLVFKPFRVPLVLKGYQKRAIEVLTKLCGGNSRLKKQVFKSVETSCRLLVGFALCLRGYYTEFEESYALDVTKRKREVTSELCNIGLLPTITDAMEKCDITEGENIESIPRNECSSVQKILSRNRILKRSTNIEAMTVNGEFSTDDGVMLEGRDNTRDEHTGSASETEYYEANMKEHVAMSMRNSKLGGVKSVVIDASLTDADDDAWLTLSSDAFQAEMSKRACSFDAKSSSNTHKEVPPNPASDAGEKNIPAAASKTPAKDMSNLDNVVQGVFDFVDTSDVNDDDNESEDDVDTPLHVDMERVLEIVQKSAKSVSLQEVSMDEAENDTEDKEQGERNINNDSFEYEEYFREMENELDETLIAESFERTVPSAAYPLGEVNIEENLLKNLMEAEAIHPGSSSPASTLMALIGKQLPSGN
jgi:hypothetical protein